MDQAPNPRRRKRATSQRISNDHLVERIREALLLFGGEAHRRDIIHSVAREAGLDVKNLSEDFEAAVIRSFEQAWRDEARRAALGFHLRFGEGSHRWGLAKAVTAH
jgi:hypothetical protein